MPHHAKHEARTAGRAARQALTAEARTAAAEAVAARLAALPELDRVRGALAYAAAGGEIDPSPAVAVLRARGVRVAYPRVCGPGALALHWVDSDGELAPGYCGILEPAAGAGEARPAQIDLVLVPGTAFDEACCRLGMGGGFYDRFLKTLRADAFAVGLAFDEQVSRSLPQEPHDTRVDAVLTPTRLLRRDRL